MGAVASLVLTGLVPGLAIAVLLRRLRPAASDVGLLAPASAWALVSWLVTSGVLARTVGLSFTSCVVAGVVLTLVSVGVLALPGSRRTLLRHSGDRWEHAWAGGALALGLVTWLPVGILSWQTSWTPLGGTSWYYWGLAQQAAVAGHLPATSVEFGTTVPFLGDYPLFTLGAAALLVQVPDDQATLVRQLVTAIPVLYAAFGFALLVRVLGAGRVVALAAVPLGIGTGLAADKLTAYRPEGFAIGCLLMAVALVAGGLRRRDVHLLAPGVGLVAVLSQVHGIALVTAFVLLASFSLALWLGDRTPATAAVVAWTGGAASAAVLLLAAVMGTLSGATHRGGISDVAGASDPTWEFVRAARGRPPSDPPDRSTLLSNGVDHIYDSGAVWFLAVAVVALAVMLAFRTGRRRFGLLVGFVAVVLVVLAAAVSVFVLGWDSYVPRRTGARRLMAEATLLLPVVVTAGVSTGVALVLLRTRSRRLATACAVGAVLVALVVGLMGSWDVSRDRLAGRIPREDVEALGRLGVTDGTVVLTNGYSEGVIVGVTGARGLLEGRAPFTFPDVLERANGLLRGAQEFYDRPRTTRDFLDAHGVDYIVVQQARSITGPFRFRVPTTARRLRKGPAFEEVLSTPRMVVFRYAPAVPAPQD
jgi:hypothetical protein